MKRTTKFNIAIGLLIFWGILALFAPYLVPHDPQKVNIALKLQRASPKFLLGTDSLGRDVLSRIIYGTRLSILIALVIQVGLVLVSLPIGLLVGWKEGKYLYIFDWVANVLVTFPSFLLAMVLVGILGTGINNMIIAVIAVEWIYYSKILKNSVIKQKQSEYVVYAKLKNMPNFYIIKKHILPFVYGPIMVASFMNIGNIILMISSFSFLGIGVQPNIPEWGNMIYDSRSFFRTNPSLMLYPGFMILFAVSSFYFIGEQFEKKLRGDI